MAELNRLMGFQPSLDICPMAIHNKQTIKKAAQIFSRILVMTSYIAMYS
jgi:hypothetical protein